MRGIYTTIIYGIITVTLTAMGAFAWYSEYANTPVHYTTIQTADEGGFEHNCLVATYKKELALDCIHESN